MASKTSKGQTPRKPGTAVAANDATRPQVPKKGARGALSRVVHSGWTGSCMRRSDEDALLAGITRLYLFAYNLGSLLAWSAVLYQLLHHLFADSPASPSTRSINAFIPGTKEHVALLGRSSTSYAAVGDLTRNVQSAALLEVLHVFVGLVRSGLGTTVAQVASRLVMVWGILIQFPQVRPL